MCWDCSSVNDDQHIYVEKSEDVKGLIWSCQKCNVNKVDVITSLKKIKEHLEEEIEEVREKIKEETVKYEEVKDKVQNDKIILEKGVIINVQEEHIEKLNDECNNNNKKIESLEIENNILKEQLEDYEPTEEMKEENRSRIKELTQKNKALETISKKKDKELNQLKGELGEYKEKTQKTNEEAEYQKDINKILVKKIKDTEKLNETLEPIMAKTDIEKSTRKYSKREETVIDNKSSTLDKEQYKVQSRGIKNNTTVNAETETQEKIDNKKELVNKVCTQYAYGKECKYGDTYHKFIHKRICKTYAKYKQCRFGRRCNFSHDVEGRCKREEEFGWCLFGKKCFYGHLLQNDTDYSRQKRGSEMEVKNRQGYQRGRHVYNNEYNRNFPSRIDNHLRHDVGINENEKVKKI